MHRVAAPLFALLVFGCAHREIHVLHAPPAAGYRTLGMVSGNGDNESAAMAQVLEQASRMDADAVVVVSTRPLGTQVVITARVIRYVAPPPGASPAPPPAEPPPPAPPY